MHWNRQEKKKTKDRDEIELGEIGLITGHLGNMLNFLRLRQVNQLGTSLADQI
jgi:hypothetical protein